MADALDIFIIPDGPVKVSGATSARYCGEPLDVDGGDIYLCRCGESSNAPFCDGSHKAAGFSGACDDPPSKEVQVWEGSTIRTFFNPNTCMHVFYCKPLKALREREVGGDAAAAAEIARVVRTCPSGALTYELKADVSVSHPTAPAAPIDIIEGGEIRIRSPYRINEERMARQGEERATLCRCGRSKNKPWCDGRHRARKDFR